MNFDGDQEERKFPLSRIEFVLEYGWLRESFCENIDKRSF